jgi:hypothetical protein
MASVTLMAQYNVTLTGPEMRLVCLALDGRIKFDGNGADAVAARELGNMLFKARHTLLANAAAAHQGKQESDEQARTA